MTKRSTCHTIVFDANTVTLDCDDVIQGQYLASLPLSARSSHVPPDVSADLCISEHTTGKPQLSPLTPDLPPPFHPAPLKQTKVTLARLCLQCTQVLSKTTT